MGTSGTVRVYGQAEEHGARLVGHLQSYRYHAPFIALVCGILPLQVQGDIPGVIEKLVDIVEDIAFVVDHQTVCGSYVQKIAHHCPSTGKLAFDAPALL
jgi:hypothetical protein